MQSIPPSLPISDIMQQQQYLHQQQQQQQQQQQLHQQQQLQQLHYQQFQSPRQLQPLQQLNHGGLQSPINYAPQQLQQQQHPVPGYNQLQSPINPSAGLTAAVHSAAQSANQSNASPAPVSVAAAPTPAPTPVAAPTQSSSFSGARKRGRPSKSSTAGTGSTSTPSSASNSSSNPIPILTHKRGNRSSFGNDKSRPTNTSGIIGDEYPSSGESSESEAEDPSDAIINATLESGRNINDPTLPGNNTKLGIALRSIFFTARARLILEDDIKAYPALMMSELYESLIFAGHDADEPTIIKSLNAIGAIAVQATGEHSVKYVLKE